MCKLTRLTCHCGPSGFNFSPCTKTLTRSFSSSSLTLTSLISPWEPSDHVHWCTELLYSPFDPPSFHFCRAHEIENTLKEKEKGIRDEEYFRKKMSARKGEVKIEDKGREEKFERKVGKLMRVHLWAAQAAQAELEKEKMEEEVSGVKKWGLRSIDMECQKCGKDLAPMDGRTGRQFSFVLGENVVREVLRQYQLEGRKGSDRKTGKTIAVICEWEKEELTCPAGISSCVVEEDLSKRGF